MKRKRKRKTLKGYLKFVICFSVTDKIYFRITCLSVSLKFERYEVAKHIISKNLRAFTSKILKFLVFSKSKHYFIYFNNSLYNSFKIKCSNFFLPLYLNILSLLFFLFFLFFLYYLFSLFFSLSLFNPTILHLLLATTTNITKKQNNSHYT